MQWYNFEEFENSGVVLVLDLCNAEQDWESVILCSVCGQNCARLCQGASSC